jgi:hypothetical protein
VSPFSVTPDLEHDPQTANDALAAAVVVAVAVAVAALCSCRRRARLRLMKRFQGRGIRVDIQGKCIANQLA